VRLVRRLSNGESFSVEDPQMHQNRGDPAAGQRSLKNHATAILACDFFIAVTANFRMLYVLVVNRARLAPPGTRERHGHTRARAGLCSS